MTQKPLFKVEASLRPLTDRQQRVYDLFRLAADGLTAPELGARIHAGQMKHGPDEQCEWCGRDGARLLRERGIRQRLIRRPGGVYEPRDVRDRAGYKPPESSRPLPGESWEDAFGTDSPLTRPRDDEAA